MKMQVPADPFRLPNFILIRALGSSGKISVGELSDEDAIAYWDWMKDKWLEHVRNRRSVTGITEAHGQK